MTRKAHFRAAGLAAVLALGAGACSRDAVLDVAINDIIRAENLTGPLALNTLRAGALADFAFTFAGNNGGTEGGALITGQVADEFFLADTFLERQEYDRRQMDERNTIVQTYYRNLHRVRETLERATAEFLAVPAANKTAAQNANQWELMALKGYTYLLLAEHFCSPQPISTFDLQGNVTFGPPQTRQQILNTAIAKFDSAITGATALGGAAATGFANLARVGRARAQLHLGDIAGASTTAAAVPATYRYNLVYSTTPSPGRQTNGIYWFNDQSRRWSMADREAATGTEATAAFSGVLQGNGIGLDFRGANDTRVQWRRGNLLQNQFRGFNNAAPLFIIGKYSGLGNVNSGASPITIASGVEAQLMVAEAQALAGNAAFLTTLNNLRDNAALYPAQVAGFSPAQGRAAGDVRMPLLTDPATADERINLVFRERAFWLYATATRMGDLRRLLRAPYNRPEAGTWPGANSDGSRRTFLGERAAANTATAAISRDLMAGGGVYGRQVSLPITFDERNNPDWVACNPEQP